METRKSSYLADGVYVEDEGFQLRLFTERGFGIVHEVYLEYDAGFKALLDWVARTKGITITIEQGNDSTD